MGTLSRRRFGLAALSLLSAGCLSDGSSEGADRDPERAASRNVAGQATATADGPTETATAGSAETATPTTTADNDSAAEFTVGDRRERSRVVGREFLLDENAYENLAVTFETTTRLTYDLIVRRGPPVDVILFTAEEFAAFQRRHRARHLAEAGSFHTTNVADRSVTIPPGEYRIVVNNTDWPRAVPRPGSEFAQLEGSALIDFEYRSEPATESD